MFSIYKFILQSFIVLLLAVSKVTITSNIANSTMNTITNISYHDYTGIFLIF